MGAFTFENEHTSPVPAATLYKALVDDAPIVLPKVDEAIKSIEILEGNGGAGTIKKLTFVEGLCVYSYIIQARRTMILTYNKLLWNPDYVWFIL